MQILNVEDFEKRVIYNLAEELEQQEKLIRDKKGQISLARKKGIEIG